MCVYVRGTSKKAGGMRTGSTPISPCLLLFPVFSVSSALEVSSQPGHVLHGQLSAADEGMSAQACVSRCVGVNVSLYACLTLDA